MPAGGVEVALPEQQVNLRTVGGAGGGADSARPLLERSALLFKRGDALVRCCCHVEVPYMRSNRRFSGKLGGKAMGGGEPLISCFGYLQCRRENLAYQQLTNPSQGRGCGVD